MDHEMPADPFRDGMLDWGPLAAGNFAFFTAHLAAGFTRGAGAGPDRAGISASW